MAPQRRRVTKSKAEQQAPPATKWDTRYVMLCVAVLCQLATVLITWPVWGVREDPVNLPLVPAPAIAFGVPIIVSLLAALLRPREGVAAHAAVFALACALDQYRLQPQFISLLVLMAACTFDAGAWFARWYLAAMWFWSGLHKVLSPEWLGWGSWTFLEECGIHADGWHGYFAIVVAVSEIGLGLLAMFAPRRAAVFCIVIHLGILLALSPLGRNFNPSVWPWNLATAVVGAWVLRQETALNIAWLRTAIVAALLLVPAGFYLDLVNPHLAFVLYSGNMPRAFHTTPDSLKRIDGWGKLTVPFPDSPRLFLQVFRRTAHSGDKLYIGDPRWGLPNRYFVKDLSGIIREITREQFLHSDESAEVAGIEIADPALVWRIAREGVALDRLEEVATLSGPQFDDATLVRVAELPNLRQLKIDGANITDAGLSHLGKLPRLEILEIKRCPITDRGLPSLAACAELTGLHLEAVSISSDGLRALDNVRQLEVLHLPATKIDDAGLAHIGGLTKLTWLDLNRTAITGSSLDELHALKGCTWINLSETQVDDHALQQLANLSSLEIVELAGTKIGDAGLAHLARLPNCRHLDLQNTAVTDSGLDSLSSLANLRMLKLHGARVTPQAVERLRARLPGCTIEM